MPNPRASRSRGFKIQKEWNSWDKKWFKRAEKNRERLKQNRARYNSHDGNIIGFVRTLPSLRKVFKLNLVKFVDPIVLSKKTPGPVEMLDSGAGYGFISAGLKLRFGRRIRVTALGWEEMPSIKEVRRMLAEEMASYDNDPNAQIQRGILSSASEFLPEYAKARRKIKRAGVFFENFTPGKQYDLIIDFIGPIRHTSFHTRTAEQIFNLLKPNGTAILGRYSFFTKEAQELANPNGKYARETGYYLKINEAIKQFDVITKVPVQKVPVPQKRKPKDWVWSLRTN